MDDQDGTARAGGKGSETLRAALAAVAELGEAGFACVPSRPSTAMLRAGAAAGGVTLKQAEKIYRAMLSVGE